MDKAQLISPYFPEITEKQRNQFDQLGDLYASWNEKINVISRKDIEQLYLRHVLHSLSIAKVINFSSKDIVLDAGTGGGFPGIPLAILFPKTQFLLVDSTNKKLTVASSIAETIGLNNVKVQHGRLEDLNQEFTVVVTRAVATLNQLQRWLYKPVKKINQKKSIALYALKGGDLTEEIAALSKKPKIHEISQWFEDSFFETKKIVEYKL